MASVAQTTSQNTISALLLSGQLHGRVEFTGDWGQCWVNTAAPILINAQISNMADGLQQVEIIEFVCPYRKEINLYVTNITKKLALEDVEASKISILSADYFIIICVFEFDSCVSVCLALKLNFNQCKTVALFFRLN